MAVGAVRAVEPFPPPQHGRLRHWLCVLRHYLRHRVCLSMGGLRDELEHLCVRLWLLVHGVSHRYRHSLHSMPFRLLCHCHRCSSVPAANRSSRSTVRLLPAARVPARAAVPVWNSPRWLPPGPPRHTAVSAASPSARSSVAELR